MNYMIINGELYHYGLKGMKWGQRRWQYNDGRFNDAGKARYFGENSSHRPDSVRELQGDKPKGSSSSKENTSTPKESNFDKDKAKKIAKNVAIGAAVVGGTVLVAYGGYKLHQAGGFSGVSRNLQTQMRETKLENLRLKQEYKTEVAMIKSEGKKNLAQIKENTKTEIKNIREEGKFQRRILDPNSDLNNGVVSAAKKAGSAVAKAATSDTAKNAAKTVSETTVKAAKSVAKAVTSDTAKNVYKAAGNATAKAAKTVAKAATSDIAKNAYKAAGKTAVKAAKTAGSATAKAAKTTAQIVSEYRKEHPNSTMSAQQIIKSVSGTGSEASKSSVPKLTLTPDTINAGTNFLVQATKTYQTVAQINLENSSKAKKGQKAVDDYTDRLLKKGK